jgi:hypothetical protein
MDWGRGRLRQRKGSANPKGDRYGKSDFAVGGWTEEATSVWLGFLVAALLGCGAEQPSSAELEREGAPLRESYAGEAAAATAEARGLVSSAKVMPDDFRYLGAFRLPG